MLFLLEGFMVIVAIDTFCKDISPVLKMIGELLNLFKISLPLILITLCIVDIGKATLSNKPANVKTNIKNCVKKLAVSLIVFFIPMICMIIFGFVDRFRIMIEDSGIDYDVCYNCMFNPKSSTCLGAVDIAN